MLYPDGVGLAGSITEHHILVPSAGKPSSPRVGSEICFDEVRHVMRNALMRDQVFTGGS